jgi:hypothetical protein
MRVVWIVLGIVLFLLGGLWTLQGLDLVGTTGQGMTGNKLWAVIGPIVAIVGIVLFAIGARGKKKAAV